MHLNAVRLNIARSNPAGMGTVGSGIVHSSDSRILRDAAARRRTGRWRVAIAGVLLAGLCLAGLQVARAASPRPVLSGALNLPLQVEANLTPTQMRAQAEKFLPQMQLGSKSVREQLAQARAARDVVKTLCLNDKLNQIDVAVSTATDRLGSLQVAAERQDAERSKHEYQVLQVLRDRVGILVAEANQCIGEETGFVGESSVTMEVDPDIPDDPTAYPDPAEGLNPNNDPYVLDPYISTPPQFVSPTQ